ncbi:dTDP-4-dehydrorhamnose 3,5-epimerase [Asticcacaulis tiandongensis]|uniref:dTDP-4-dehydrorhamnose 3,5-epimerase n=1 Tax=Asticcacaulis tiandongensis TaxID=2565365 RepID=UPI00112A56AC|nr:dTDP-4-dehydrorhamnose 3,5-epimerase [Asticcacaulis tiandongensis]
MHYKTYPLSGLALITPIAHGDTRGQFMETFRDDWFRKHIADVTFVQDNQAFSATKGTLRGLHYQLAPYAQGKLVRCLKGAIFDVAVDIRPESPTFGQWVGEVLTAENRHQLWVPEGFAHGYCTLIADTEVFYKVTRHYMPAHDRGIRFDDPDIGIDWPIDISDTILSTKDRAQPHLKEAELELKS